MKRIYALMDAASSRMLFAFVGFGCRCAYMMDENDGNVGSEQIIRSATFFLLAYNTQKYQKQSGVYSKRTFSFGDSII